MPKVSYTPIGSQTLLKDRAFEENKNFNEELDNNLYKKRQQVFYGLDKKYEERVHDKGKLTAIERINLLADKKEDILHINSLVNYEVSPLAGVLTSFVKIHDLWCVVIANDNRLASGAWWPKTPEKIIRAQEIALKLSIPVIYLVDCSGLYLPEQGKTFPGKYGAGKIFKMNSLLSDKGVPQIAGVCGDCIAGGGYMPIISDKVFMTKNSYMVIAGSALIKGAKSQHLSSHDIGGPHIHVAVSACADEMVPDDELMLKKIRLEIKKLPSSAKDFYRHSGSPLDPAWDEEELYGLLPKNFQNSYDIKEVIARLVDLSLFHEYAQHTGKEVLCGLAKINGLNVGILANRQDLIEHPQNQDQKRPGGILYKEGVAKLSSFVRMLNDDGIPMIWFLDVSGFDVGLEAEKQGLLAYGSNLIYTNSTISTPAMTVLLRKASGAGYYAMDGMPYDPVLQLSTPQSRLSVMEGKTLAMAALVTKDQKTPEEIIAIEQKIEEDMSPYKSASQMDTDEIVLLKEIRKYLQWFSESSYQTIGTRRIKNPRIWSIFDHLTVYDNYNKPPTKEKNNTHKEDSDFNNKEDGILVKSPLDGLVYLRASPSDEFYIKINHIIKPGQIIALIEVMKSFYPIKYEGSANIKIKKIMIEDQSPVKNGQIIFLGDAIE